uniref:Uncharacterized protein n=1 Tax=Knipowitschia caucasica TaxID=637954 RepID=A0AAV2KGM2_KNICA
MTQTLHLIPCGAGGSGTETSQTGTEASPSETEASPSGTEASPSGTEASPSGTEASQTETEASQTETEASPSGTEASPSGTEASPSGTEASQTETEASQTETEASQTETEASQTETEASPSETEAIAAVFPERCPYLRGPGAVHAGSSQLYLCPAFHPLLMTRGRSRGVCLVPLTDDDVVAPSDAAGEGQAPAGGALPVVTMTTDLGHHRERTTCDCERRGRPRRHG